MAGQHHVDLGLLWHFQATDKNPASRRERAHVHTLHSINADGGQQGPMPVVGLGTISHRCLAEVPMQLLVHKLYQLNQWNGFGLWTEEREDAVAEDGVSVHSMDERGWGEVEGGSLLQEGWQVSQKERSTSEGGMSTESGHWI